ncbi:TetR/AcrR family transcriptional regulator [Fontibacillus sp. BL9]|uniref:TetR/AcrR family transcriptional regulator n=1 Tax=Fontibacillus sp. BL9 TaxID=3389971 RepID=UPI00397A5104
MNSNSKRNQLLAAALLIVKTQGVEKLTLESVAKEAGISKGGLLHHFPNKQALINAMVEETTNRYFSDIHERATNDSNEVGKWSRAYIHATFDEKQEDNGVNAALIASLFANPDLLSKLKNHYSFWQAKIENDGIDQVKATIVRLAVDGLWFSDIFGVGDLNDDLKQQVIDYLSEMSQ